MGRLLQFHRAVACFCNILLVDESVLNLAVLVRSHIHYVSSVSAASVQNAQSMGPRLPLHSYNYLNS